MPDQTTPAKLILFTNGMIMAFDGNGQQMPDLQGPAETALGPALAAAGPGTVFALAEWRRREWDISREGWEAEAGRFACTTS